MILKETEYEIAVRNAEHYLAVGQDDVHLWHTNDLSVLPWEYVTSVEDGGVIRLGIPTSFHFKAKHPCGLTFSWLIDIEKNNANGTGTTKLDEKTFYDLASKLPKVVIEKFIELLENKILPDVQKRTSEIKSALYTQLMSETILEETIKKLRVETK